MKPLALVIAFLSLFFSFFGSASDNTTRLRQMNADKPWMTIDSGKLCIETFNLYTPAYASHVEKRLKGFVQSLTKDKPPCQILHIQELWTPAKKSFFLEDLQKALDYSFFAIDQTSDKKTGLLTLIFSPLKITYLDEVLFEENFRGIADGVRKGLNVYKSFQLIETAHYFLINTHLHPSNQGLRLAQIFQISRHFEKNLNKPFFLSGDFNFTPKSLEHQIVTQVFKLKDSSEAFPLGCTYCNDNPYSWSDENRKIDSIYFSSSKFFPIESVSSAVFRKKYKKAHLSDHYSLKSCFESAFFKKRMSSKDVKNNRNNNKLVLKAISIMKKHKIKPSLIQQAKKFLRQ